MFFSRENMEQARAKIYEEKMKIKKEQDQDVISVLDNAKESIRNQLAVERFCLPIRDAVDKPLVCSWFAAHGLVCDKTVFISYECGYDGCCWAANLKKTPKTWWNRFFQD
jgi:hypothetical protein